MSYNRISFIYFTAAQPPDGGGNRVKRPVPSHILTFALGFVLGCGLLFLTLTQGWLPNTRVTITTGTSNSSVNTIVSSNPAALSDSPEQDAGSETLLARALETAAYLRDGDWAALAGCVHPEKGVTFTPYSSVSDSDLCFTPEEVAAFGGDTKTYLWGAYDGSGAPMNLTVAEYFPRFVTNADYTQAPFLAVDRVISSGNAVENVADAYPDAHFVELYYSSLDPSKEGFDWCGIKLVFEPADGQLMLVGIIHSEWTI